jgi:hypothetical protein
MFDLGGVRFEPMDSTTRSIPLGSFNYIVVWIAYKCVVQDRLYDVSPKKRNRLYDG